ncbi:hypothetical protein DPMN_150427 [Dreissena polymorpha]|uniref:Uncharacterized protein n=1 Tax=Dreissena polymorpha TaxID=45954 RepID=A0A9D4J6B3_DREPO|nr:hypothetical protein DPMN_150427 [Dreissena polymorpha]
MLLNAQYNIVSDCHVSGCARNICQITCSEVAVIIGSDVQFISVRNGQLITGRKFQLPHGGIAHHHGKLHITSGSALYHYTLTGTLVKKLYEDTGGCDRGNV